MADRIPATQEKLYEDILVHVVKLADDMERICNGYDDYARRAAASLIAQQLWPLVDKLEAGEPVMFMTNES
jgi:hypothetical protein